MREDYLEVLEKMFPKGYVITYIMPNDDPAFNWCNPNKDEFLIAYLEMLEKLFLNEENNEQNS